ncbi:MAG: PQQ-binding-like beta-propeller repeat protein [Bacteroidetes bacterium]|nr:PQQ-binding-like beta-propeller repeat protein [Bacteroidota bacterium]MBU1423177.1 PQQ-binding-like beta-propeller repeat protein [Bacteroidota bacterium]
MRSFNRNIVFFIAGALFSLNCISYRLDKYISPKSSDWTMYGGGINRTNHSEVLPIPPLAPKWEFNTGAGFGTFSGVVADSILFATTLKGELHLLNIQTGKNLGKKKFSAPIVGGPAIGSGVVYLSFAVRDISVGEYDLSDKKFNWTLELSGVESSPLIVGNQLFVTTSEGKLVAIEKKSGVVNWTFSDEPIGILKSSRSSPASDGKKVVYGNDNGVLYAVDIDNGKLIWRYKSGGSIAASPAIKNNIVYFGSMDGNLYAIDISDGKLIWKYETGSPVYSSAAVSDSYVYIGGADGVLRCINNQSGKLVWSFKAQSVFGSAPLISDKIIYIGSFDKNLYVLDAVNGNLVWSYLLNGRIKSSPLVWKNFLFVFTDDQIITAFTPIKSGLTKEGGRPE